MPWDVQFHPDLVVEIDGWDEQVRVELLSHAGLLAAFGPTLGRPAVDTLKGSGVWRVAFAFDGRRIAVLLAVGDKRGRMERRFYKSLIGLAERRWESWR